MCHMGAQWSQLQTLKCMQGTGSPQDPLLTLKFYDLFQNVPNLAKMCFSEGLK